MQDFHRTINQRTGGQAAVIGIGQNMQPCAGLPQGPPQRPLIPTAGNSLFQNVQPISRNRLRGGTARKEQNPAVPFGENRRVRCVVGWGQRQETALIRDGRMHPHAIEAVQQLPRVRQRSGHIGIIIQIQKGLPHTRRGMNGPQFHERIMPIGRLRRGIQNHHLNRQTCQQSGEGGGRIHRNLRIRVMQPQRPHRLFQLRGIFRPAISAINHLHPIPHSAPQLLSIF